MASNRSGLNDTGYTHRDIYKQEKALATDEDILSVWTENVPNKSNYRCIAGIPIAEKNACYCFLIHYSSCRLKGLTGDRKKEFTALHHKITGLSHVYGGMVSKTMATAYYLHTKGEQINWLSFKTKLDEEREKRGTGPSKPSGKRKHTSDTESEDEEETRAASEERLDKTHPRSDRQSNMKAGISSTISL